MRFAVPGLPLLLSTPQERVLWQEIIQRENRTLFDVSGMAAMAMRAARLTAEWHIPLHSEAWTEHEDASHFQRWYEIFRTKCRDNNWATRADVWELLPAWIAKRNRRAVRTIFVGFDNPVPALRSLVESDPELFRLENFESVPPVNCVPATAFESFAEELDYAARWARAKFEEQRHQSVAVFIPNLQQHRSTVERVFQHVLYPAAALRPVLGSTREKASVFHIAGTVPVADHPLIAGALLMLELARPPISVSDAGAILRSPFLAGAAEERNARALADVGLRRKRTLDASLRDLEWASRNCPRLAPLWSRINEVLSAKPSRAEFSYWSEFAGRLLKETGWPGDGDLNEEDQSAIDAWEDGIADLATLDLVSAAVTWDEAIAHLRELLPSGGEIGTWDSPIQILDATEAAGLQFEAAIFCGLSDDTWPPRVEYGSPLIPLKLQRACGIPGSTPQSARAERERLTRALFGAAPVLFATYLTGSSSALHGFEEQDKNLLIWNGKTPWESYLAVELEQLEDSQAPPFVADGVARGGTGLIRAQSQCPFRAFAEYRLRAHALEDGSLGMDPLARGTTLHKALELVWRRLKSSEALHAVSPSELQCLVRDAIHEAVRTDESSGLRRVLTAVERERLEELILEWLAVERARVQPFTVEFVEEKRAVELAGLPLDVRLDRVDRLKTGHALLLDYKSGKQTKGKLECPRPDEPQLLVYAATVDDRVDGVILAQLQARDCKAAGFTREKQFDRRTVEVKGRDWSKFLDDARQEVAEIATQFRSGWAAVDPSKGACEFCRTKSLCRVCENSPVEAETE
jgi:probable DNA repair protein